MIRRGLLFAYKYCLTLLVECLKILGNHLVGNRVVLQVTLDESFVRRHIDETVTREVEEDDFLLAGLLALLCLADSGGNGVGALRSRDDALGTSEEHASLEGLELRNIHTMHQTVLNQLADNHAGTMIAQTTSVDVAWFEVVA